MLHGVDLFVSSHAVQTTFGTVATVAVAHILARRDRRNKNIEQKQATHDVHERVNEVEQVANGQLVTALARVKELEAQNELLVSILRTEITDTVKDFDASP